MQLLQYSPIIRHSFIEKKAENDVKNNIERCNVDDDAKKHAISINFINAVY